VTRSSQQWPQGRRVKYPCKHTKRADVRRQSAHWYNGLPLAWLPALVDALWLLEPSRVGGDEAGSFEGTGGREGTEDAGETEGTDETGGTEGDGSVRTSGSPDVSEASEVLNGL